jgi:hypothetical protein
VPIRRRKVKGRSVLCGAISTSSAHRGVSETGGLRWFGVALSVPALFQSHRIHFVPPRKPMTSIPRKRPALLPALILLLLGTATLQAREWRFAGVDESLEAEFVGMGNGAVVLQGANGKSFELPIDRFSLEDQRYLRALDAANTPFTGVGGPGKPITNRSGYKVRTAETLTNQVVTVGPGSELHVTGKGDPIKGTYFNLAAADGWLFFPNIVPSKVAADFLGRVRVNGVRAVLDENLRVAQYESGSVVIPQGADFPAMTVFDGKSLGGSATPLKCHIAYDDAKLGAIRSFVLKRGYMATIAQRENGTGISRNYVAQDHDLVVGDLPAGLDNEVRFVRIFPWRWVGKKGVAGNIWKNLNVGWFYNWNINGNSSLDLEYVPIRQNRHWPGLNQDWRKKDSTHLLGFNEPDRPDQSKMTVDEAIRAWPVLLGTGLRLGSPAPSDGGLKWLYEFMDKADAAGLRVDFVAVHYYRAIQDPGDAKGAAEQFHQFLKGVHDRVKRPLWVTEWNNGANWTKAPKPTSKQQEEAIGKMIEMLDKTPFVERYAIYNWVEEMRFVERKDGTLTPAGEVYRDKVSPLSHIQAKPGN